MADGTPPASVPEPVLPTTTGDTAVATVATVAPSVHSGYGDMPAKRAAIRTIAMPSDTNPAGDIFGGWLMAQMDLAAGNTAARRARGRCATVKVNEIVFFSPVHVGDEVSVFADVIRVGRTSMDIDVQVWRRSRDGDHAERVTHAVFTFVALDAGGRPRPVPRADT